MALRCVTSLTAILAPHCAGNLYFYLWRTAGLFFFPLFFSLSVSLPPSPLYLIHKMLFLSLTSTLSNCYKQGRIGLMEPEDRRCIGNVYQSVVCCRKAAAFVYQIKISVWKSEARVTKFCPSVCYSVVLQAAAEFLCLPLGLPEQYSRRIYKRREVGIWGNLIVIAVLWDLSSWRQWLSRWLPGVWRCVVLEEHLHSIFRAKERSVLTVEASCHSETFAHIYKVPPRHIR